MPKEQPKVMELETFLPQENGFSSPSKHKIQPAKDVERQRGGEDEFDPFIDRPNLPNGTTDCETLTHLLKAALGTGILAMPEAFRNSGLLVGLVSIFIVSFICTHCGYVLVKCGHKLYKLKKVTQMTFGEVSEEGFKSGPKWAHKFAVPSKYLIKVLVFITYFGTCSVYTVIIAENFSYVITYYSASALDVRIYIVALLPPLIFLSYVPNLKRLAPVSMVANVCMLVGLVITLYYVVDDLPSINTVKLAAPVKDWPKFFSISIFAIEAIGVVMPLENNMKTPTHFLGICGVLSRGMSGVTLVYLLLGFLGYIKYGDHTKGSVTLNLPRDAIPAQIVQILIGIAVFCTYGLQFFVCLEIIWDAIKHKYTNHPTIANYILRTILVILSVGLAAAVPTISPFISLIGAFCFSLLGLLVPVCIESVMYWDDVGFKDWRTYKNIIIAIFAVMALVFGSLAALKDIVKVYTS